MNTTWFNVFLLVSLAIAASTAAGSPVIYWRFENSGVSEMNSPTVDLTLASTVTFSTDVPGALMSDGGIPYANTMSYRHGTGTASITTDHAVAREAIDSAAGFTVEFFVKIDDGATAAQLLRWDTILASDSWSLSLNADQMPQFAATTAAFPDPTVPLAKGYLIAPGTLSEGVWHHVAAVGTVVDYYPASWTLYENVTLYIDYQSVGQKRYYAQAGQVPQHPRLQWKGSDSQVGWQNAFNGGLIDEIRISDEALDPNDFLHVYTGPTTPTSCAEVWALGYGLAEDLNKDCRVDSEDIQRLLEKWMQCNDPQDSGCK